MTNPYAQGYLYQDLGRQYQDIVRWALTSGDPMSARLAQLAQQTKAFFIDLTDGDTQSFSNHFARMSYVCQATDANARLTYYLHQFDREASRHLRGNETKLTDTETLRLGARALLDVIEATVKLACPPELSALLPSDYESFKLQSYTVTEFKPQLRAIVLEDLTDRSVLRVRLVQDPGLDHLVHYAREGYNTDFVGAAVTLIRNHFTLPLEVNLIAVEVDAAGELTPGHLIIDPDFLVDITQVSNCFEADGAEPMKYLLGRMSPFTSSVALMAGNVANHFLDTAVGASGERKPFLTGFAETFAFYPLQYARLSDEEVRELMTKCEGHYAVIGDCLSKHLPGEQIDCGEVSVEPSFYAERYGLQGRLDLFLAPQGGREAAIVELKSGKIFRPNEHQVSHSHYVQTLLYDLLVRSVFSKYRTRPRNYILYSGDKDKPLRYAPPNKAQQYKALAVRNVIMSIELLLSQSKAGEAGALDGLRPDRYPKASGYTGRDLNAFHAAYSGLSVLEKDYFRSFTGFIAREQRLAKVGTQSVERLSGQSTLWREDLEVKLDGYAILHDLDLQTIAQKAGFPVLTLLRSPKQAGDGPPLTSFRRGDIVVLYAGDARRQAVLHHQVYKGTITRIDDERVDVRLRAAQPDLTQFERFDRWNIEGDLFDSSFTRLYQNLAEFAAASPSDRARALGMAAPEKPTGTTYRAPTALTTEQASIFRSILNARSYYLLWGPPGTGKTSVMLHHICDHFANKTKERILVLAFTNRAVDEICRAVSAIGGDIERRYVRIGSAHGCAPEFGRQLLQTRIAHMKTREQIKKLLHEQRIIVGTVSSVLGKAEALFDLVSFDRLIIDEASQLLEPQVVNLIARFPRTVLIGDHRQLPAVVTQSAANTLIDDAGLRDIGLTDMRNSLFERLYARCQAESWDWAFGQLTRQGRMHTQLANYANEAFYDGNLRGLELRAPSEDWQLLDPSYRERPSDLSPLETLFCQHTTVFVDTPADLSDKAFRTNVHEARAVVAAIASFIRIKKEAHTTLEPTQIGVITPYRAQIARIRATIVESDLPEEWNSVTVDTVERFQGASYDIVLLSLCANHPSMVLRLSSTNAENRDRKLNVALTRARERVIAFGNIEMLQQHNPAYAHYIEHCEQHGGVWRDAEVVAALNAVGSSAAEFEAV